MPFREKQKLPLYGGAPVKFRVSKIDEDGQVTESFEDANVKLPDREVMRLGNVLKAGVPLKEVNSKLLGSDSFTLEESKSLPPKSAKSGEPSAEPDRSHASSGGADA